jgi:hypothetical protein
MTHYVMMNTKHPPEEAERSQHRYAPFCRVLLVVSGLIRSGSAAAVKFKNICKIGIKADILKKFPIQRQPLFCYNRKYTKAGKGLIPQGKTSGSSFHLLIYILCITFAFPKKLDLISGSLAPALRSVARGKAFPLQHR